MNDLDIQQLWDVLSQEIPYLIEDRTTASSETVPKSWIEAVYRHFYQKQPVWTIAYELGLPLKATSKYIAQFRKSLKKRSNTNLKYLEKKRLLQNNHLEFINNLITSQNGYPLTIYDVSLKLQEEFEDIVNVSKSTIRRRLKKDLKMSYKKVTKVNPNLFLATNITKMTKCAWVLKKLREQEIKIIFVDEFSVSARSFKPFTWSPVGSKPLYINKTDSFKCSFMVGLSSEAYYGVYGTNETF